MLRDRRDNEGRPLRNRPPASSGPPSRPHKPNLGTASAEPAPKHEARVYFYDAAGLPLRRTGATFCAVESGAQPIRWPINALPRTGEYITAPDGKYRLVTGVAHDLPLPHLHTMHVWLADAADLAQTPRA